MYFKEELKDGGVYLINCENERELNAIIEWFSGKIEIMEEN